MKKIIALLLALVLVVEVEEVRIEQVEEKIFV